MAVKSVFDLECFCSCSEPVLVEIIRDIGEEKTCNGDEGKNDVDLGRD